MLQNNLKGALALAKYEFLIKIYSLCLFHARKKP